jgi:Zn-finger nucleic acid-binding protein
MNRQAFGRISGVVVDVCKSDGVWFDAGEITQVIEFVEHGGLERARQREKDELAEQARKLQGEQVQVYARVDESWQAPRQGESLGNPSWSHLGHEFLAALTEIWRK